MILIGSDLLNCSSPFCPTVDPDPTHTDPPFQVIQKGFELLHTDGMWSMDATISPEISFNMADFVLFQPQQRLNRV